VKVYALNLFNVANKAGRVGLHLFDRLGDLRPILK
jgi:hypothetical protein